MLRRERLALYGLLGLSLLLHAVALSGGTASAAFASVRTWIQDLGPAERLTLVAAPAEDGTAVVVRVGRYGPFLQRDEATAPVPEGTCPDELTVAAATEMLAAGERAEQPIGSHPETGEPMLEKVVRRHDTYHRPGHKRAAELILVPH